MKIFSKIKFQKNGATIKKYKLCGVTLLRKEKSPFKRKYNFLGVKICKKVKIQTSTNLQIPMRNSPPSRKNTLFQYDNHVITFKRCNDPLVSIIIPVYNNFKYTKLCLKSIYNNVRNVNYEIIIADDNSTDETTTIKKVVKNITVIRNKENLRFIRNCNNAVKLAKGKYIVLLNNDTQVQKDWLESLVSTIESDEKIGLVGSKLVYPDGTLQEAGGIVYSDANACNYGNGDNPDNLEYNYVKDTDYISGASILLKKSLWEELGGFDERFCPAYYEDTDLAFQIRYKLGLKVIYQPASVVIHFEGKSNGTDLATGLKKYQSVNRLKFFEKWQNELKQFHFNPYAGNFLARDHAKGKKNILVIDWKILTFNEDTGSRTTYQYMNFFRDMGLNVKYYPYEWNISDGYLEKHLQDGFEVIQEDITHYLQKFGKYFDYVYINRPNIAFLYRDVLRKYTRATIIFQCHDLHYLRQYRNRLLENMNNADIFFQEEKNNEFNIFQSMDVVCSFSFDEVKTILKENPYINAQQIPLYILDTLKMQNYSYHAEQRNNIMFVAGFKHIPNIDAAVWFTKEIFPEIKKQLPDIKLYLVGSNPDEKVQVLASNDVIVTGYVTDEELDDYYSKIKCVVVPLRSGAGVKGKIIESIYHKVPVITTDIGIEGINNTNKIITVAKDKTEFANIVTNLYVNNNRLNELSINSFEFIHNFFTKEAVIKSLKAYIDFEKDNNK